VKTTAKGQGVVVGGGEDHREGAGRGFAHKSRLTTKLHI